MSIRHIDVSTASLRSHVSAVLQHQMIISIAPHVSKYTRQVVCTLRGFDDLSQCIYQSDNRYHLSSKHLLGPRHFATNKMKIDGALPKKHLFEVNRD